MYFVLTNLAKLIAPFVPFLAEELYQTLRKSNDPISVHLCDWPKSEKGEFNEKLILDMEKARIIVEKAHALRAEKSIRLRQPLKELKYPGNLPQEIEEIIKDEVNVLMVSASKGEVSLNTKITQDLKEQGIARDTIRLIQDLRKQAELTPNKKVNIYFEADEKLNKIISANQKQIEVATNTKIFQQKKPVRLARDCQIDQFKLWLGLL